MSDKDEREEGGVYEKLRPPLNVVLVALTLVLAIGLISLFWLRIAALFLSGAAAVGGLIFALRHRDLKSKVEEVKEFGRENPGLVRTAAQLAFYGGSQVAGQTWGVDLLNNLSSDTLPQSLTRTLAAISAFVIPALLHRAFASGGQDPEKKKGDKKDEKSA